MRVTSPLRAGGLALDQARRVCWSLLALAGAAAVCVYPVRAFLTMAELPWVVRMAWVVAAIGALLAPRASLLAFIVGAPLLPILPSRMGWPTVALAEMWLFALLVSALLRMSASGFRLQASVSKFGRFFPKPEARSPKPVGFFTHSSGGPFSEDTNAPIPAAVVVLLAVGTASLAVVLYPLHLGFGGMWPLLNALHEFARDELIVAQSQRHHFASVVTWLTCVEGIAVLWLVLRTFGSAGNRGALVLRAIGTGGALVAAAAVAQWWTGVGLLSFWRLYDPNLTRVNATFSDVNGMAAFMALSICVLLGLAGQSEARSRNAWMALAALCGGALLFTASRTAWLAAGVGGLLYLLGLWRWRLLAPGSWLARHMGRVALVTGMALIVAGASLTAYATSRNVRHHDQRTYFDVLLFTLNLNAPIEERLKGRLGFWESAIAMVRAEPLFGIGVGRYFKDVKRFAPRPEYLIQPQENAHNYYLQAAAELGLLGALAWLAVLATSIASAVQACPERAVSFIRASRGAAQGSHPPADRRLALGAGTAVVAYALCWITGHPLLVREGQFVFWPVVAATLLCGRRVDVERSQAGPKRRWAWLVCALILVSVPFRAASAVDRVDLTRLPPGLHGPEIGRDGREFRWSADRVRLYFPAEATSVQLEVQRLADFDQVIEVQLDDEVVDWVVLREPDVWVTLRYLNQRRADRARFRKLDLLVTPTWRAHGDPRELGVKITGYQWTLPTRP